MCIRDSYTGEDGLLYCGKCHTPQEAYFSKETAQWLGHDRHPSECDCQRAAREKREAAESRQQHLETVEDLQRRGFTDPAMRNWTFEPDNGRNPQTATARFYVESWETMPVSYTHLKLRTAYPTILYQSGAVTRKCCCSIFMPLK